MEVGLYTLSQVPRNSRKHGSSLSRNLGTARFLSIICCCKPANNCWIVRGIYGSSFLLRTSATKHESQLLSLGSIEEIIWTAMLLPGQLSCNSSTLENKPVLTLGCLEGCSPSSAWPCPHHLLYETNCRRVRVHEFPFLLLRGTKVGIFFYSRLAMKLIIAVVIIWYPGYKIIRGTPTAGFFMKYTQ